MATKHKNKSVTDAETPVTETVNPQDVQGAELALSQAQSPTVEIIPASPAPPPSSLWLPGGAGEFSPAIVSKRLHDAEADVGRLKVKISDTPTRISGTAKQGGTFWEGHTLRPAQTKREAAALKLAKAGRAFRAAILEYSKECPKVELTE